MEEKQKTGGQSRATMIAVTIGLAAVLCVFIFSGIGIWNKYKDTIIDNQKEQMLTIAQNVADNFEVFIEEYCADLDTLCDIAVVNDSLDWGLFEAYVNTHDHFVFDVWMEDPDGRVTRSVRGEEPLECYSSIDISESVSMRQYRLQNQEFALMIRRRFDDGRALSIIIDTRAYYDGLIFDLQLGTNGYVLLKDTNGIILMHPEEHQWGIDVIDGRMQLYENLDLESLGNMIERQNKGEKGISEYYSYWWLKPELPRVKKISAYCPAVLGDSFIIVSAVMDYNDAYLPVVEGLFKLVLVILGIIAVIFFMGLYILNLMRQQEKVTEEVQYLRELNRILEEMHQREELIAHQQRLQIMGTMTGGIAHEFNNLLTPIMGYSELLMMEIPEESSAYDSVLEIYEASMKAKEMIQQISALSRRNIETAYKNIQVARMLQRALKMVQSVCPTNVRLKNNTDFKDVCILGNETQMNQVILNICVNAIHAIGHADGRIVVTGSVVEREELESYHLSKIPDNWNYYVRIDIGDDGGGMSEDIIKQIFDPFFTTKKGGVGTGLGLALVEQIITSHKGYIFAESEPGQGSVFHIYIPLNEQKGEYRYLQRRENQEDLKLLIVDDNPKVLKLLEKSFVKHPIELFTCMDFAEARAILRQDSMDVLVTETYVSGESAVDFFMSVMAQYPELVKIMMIDKITKECAEAKRRGIIDEYIYKPVSDTSIIEAVVRQKQH